MRPRKRGACRSADILVRSNTQAFNAHRFSSRCTTTPLLAAGWKARAPSGSFMKPVMSRQLTFTNDPIDEASLISQRKLSGEMGAVVYFTGVVRGTENGVEIGALEYESFREMAEHQFHLLFDELEKCWPINSIRLVHRLGLVRVNEASLWVEIVAPHREEAFAACQWLIDRMKEVVPIWKKANSE
jgi:molybdopterin synthase catalytic subunit